MKRIRQKPFLAATFVLLHIVLLLLCLCGPRLFNKLSLNRTISTLFIEEMKRDTLNMHYTIKQPADYGILSYTPTLYVEEETNHTDKAFASLQKLSKERLSLSDQYLYQGMHRRLALIKTLEAYPYYSQPLSLNGGPLTSLILLFAEYSFEKERDITDYLALLAQSEDYLCAIGTYQKDRVDKGFTSSSSLYDSLYETAANLSALGPSILRTAFEEKLKSFSFSKQKLSLYLAKHDQALASLSKGYKELADTIAALPGATSDTPLCNLPEGESYYKALLQYKTGSFRDPTLLRTLLCEDLRQTLSDILALSDITDVPAADNLFPVLSEPAILEYLQDACMGNYPTLTTVNPIVKTVWPGMEEITAPAFYLTTPKGCDTNVIYINKSETVSPQETFATLAHEGFPGHLYQNVYQNEHQSKLQTMTGSLCGYTGYYEGWALYSEFGAYDCMADALSSQGKTAESTAISLEKLYKKLTLCMYTILDMDIHLNHATLRECIDTFASFGINGRTFAGAYQFIVRNPGYYPSYYIGYLELMNLKDYVKSLCGRNFSEMQFHSFYLEYGPTDFSTLQMIADMEF